ncbi:hypothetical protein AU468_00080 [Alkalispirochaeta sphaeroplastigenens]|uniref:[FeFe] hydrogenase H-cluster maturation GTPase HydF n=1 Tax=Alkalispirochaeta sphaeroplastigenens TaxID=1187066 RepID=A0A2S4K1H2_9SPIO|nr:[FeFe] hydrogenase H-cluster maturation GTPase HydF [Alkalispirochaeta sphaeroplastigenens]POR05611.1 hypothetical protein AU468_00080 [Alkalispirochaeta sphaeroplastigenens]
MSGGPQGTPRSMRPHIVLAGKCNAGKSALLNALVGQDLAIVSSTRGTTTDPVLRSSELLPFGPVVYVDTAGLDDTGALGSARNRKTRAALAGSDLALYTIHPARWDKDDLEQLGSCATQRPTLAVVTHSDTTRPGLELLRELERITSRKPAVVSSTSGEGIWELRDQLAGILEAARKKGDRQLLEGLIGSKRLVLLIVPIDLEAPAGRLILPQVQTIREVLDGDAATLVVKDQELPWVLDQLKHPPDLAITDSQVVDRAAALLPPEVPLTTFSILFSRLRGDLPSFVESVYLLDTLPQGSRILVTESCSHQIQCDDIGRVKIPKWIRTYTGKEHRLEVTGGTIPEELDCYDLIIHCGGCMITRRQMLARLEEARLAGVPVTNYGVAISHMQGVLERVLEPFNLKGAARPA